MNLPIDTRPPVVETQIAYLAPTNGRPRFHLDDAARDEAGTLEKVRVAIHDARSRPNPMRVDEHGFELFEHRTSLTDVTDREQVDRVYRPELRDALLEITGAIHVVITSTVFVRFARRAAGFGNPGTSVPANHVHSDCTRRTGPIMVRKLAGAECPRSLLGGRFAIYSLWRVFSAPPQDEPLALCNARSVLPADAILTDIVVRPDAPGGEAIYEGIGFRHSPNHEWFYYRDMHRDELLLIKAYDSDTSRAWCVPHTGFVDPSAPPNAPARVSIDVRAVAFFG